MKQEDVKKGVRVEHAYSHEKGTISNVGEGGEEDSVFVKYDRDGTRIYDPAGGRVISSAWTHIRHLHVAK